MTSLNMNELMLNSALQTDLIQAIIHPNINPISPRRNPVRHPNPENQSH